MIKKQIFSFLLHWLVSGVGMWICISLFGAITVAPDFWTYVVAGLVFALVDAIVKPLLSIIALPFAMITLGLWSVLISVAVVGITVAILPDVSMDFLDIVLSTVVMSVVNSIANVLLPVYEKK